MFSFRGWSPGWLWTWPIGPQTFLLDTGATYSVANSFSLSQVLTNSWDRRAVQHLNWAPPRRSLLLYCFPPLQPSRARSSSWIHHFWLKSWKGEQEKTCQLASSTPVSRCKISDYCLKSFQISGFLLNHQQGTNFFSSVTLPSSFEVMED